MHQDKKGKIQSAIEEYYWESKKEFIPGETFIPTGLAIYDGREVNAIVKALMSERLGLSVIGRKFEKKSQISVIQNIVQS